MFVFFNPGIINFYFNFTSYSTINVNSTINFSKLILCNQQPAGIRLSISDRRRIQSTSEFSRALSVMKESRRRLGEIKQFISSKYPAVARRLIKPISAHDLTNPAYHWFGSKTDFGRFGDRVAGQCDRVWFRLPRCHFGARPSA